MKEETKKETKQIKVYEIAEPLFQQVLNYIANSKSDFKTADVVNFSLQLHNLKPIEKIEKIEKEVKTETKK